MIRIVNIALVLLLAAVAISSIQAGQANFEYPRTRLGLISHPYFSAWAGFKNAYRRSFLTMEEELARFRTFVSHHRKIEEHNNEHKAGRKSYSLKMNIFGDMAPEEFRVKMNGFKPSLAAKKQQSMFRSNFISGNLTGGSKLPESVDWREKGYVTKVKNQGECGSCWSFSTTGALEGQYFKKSGKLVELSEQNLVDCSNENEGCNGGLMDLAFEYIKNNGIDTESDYPYTGMDGRCHFTKENTVTKDTGYVDLPENDEAALQVAIAKVGPVSVAIDASHWSFQFYDGGVYDEHRCTQNLDHAVLAVGYGVTKEGQKYYIVKNSWSEEWGENGYIRMTRDKDNQCGIASMPSYPVL